MAVGFAFAVCAIAAFAYLWDLRTDTRTTRQISTVITFVVERAGVPLRQVGLAFSAVFSRILSPTVSTLTLKIVDTGCPRGKFAFRLAGRIEDWIWSLVPKDPIDLCMRPRYSDRYFGPFQSQVFETYFAPYCETGVAVLINAGPGITS